MRTGMFGGGLGLAAMMNAVRESEDEVRADADAAARYRLQLLGDPGLKVPATPVDREPGVALGLITALEREMRQSSGLGMAAQQVGGTQRVCILRLARTKGYNSAGRTIVVMINPVIVERAPTVRVHPMEGCLSVPGFRTSTRRHPWITVDYHDRDFVRHRETLHDMDAQIVQHELDHLDGKCIADGVSRQQRKRAEALVVRARSRQ